MNEQVKAKHLFDLIEQWEETVSLYKTDLSMRKIALGYIECIAELKQIVNGDLSAIEKW